MKYGGPDGELAASLRYLSQKFSMVTPQAKATLNDIGTEEYVPQPYHLLLGMTGYIVTRKSSRLLCHLPFTVFI